MSVLNRIVFIIIFSATASSLADGQQLVIKTKKIQLLIEEWNIVHNARSINAFQDLYDQKLLYYGEQMNRNKAISLKREFFDSKPDFRQRLTSDIDYTIHTSGVIKCEFGKDAWEDGGWRPYRMYLLVAYRDSRFWIVGESDQATDKGIGYVLDIGEPIEIENLSGKLGHGNTDSSSVGTSSSNTSPGRMTNSRLSLSRDAVTITVRKVHLYVLGGVFFGAGLLILISRGFKAKKRKRSQFTRSAEVHTPPQNNPPVTPQPTRPTVVPVQQPIPPPAPAPVKEPDPVVETDNSYIGIEHHLKQTAFRNYVIGLFQLSSFTYIKPKANSVSPTDRDEDDPQPILEFQGESENGLENFGVQSLYREDTNSNEVALFSKEHLDFNQQFAGEIDLYYLLGIGGAPDKPHGLYLIPAREMDTPVISREQLKKFRKSGLFLYYKGRLR